MRYPELVQAGKRAIELARSAGDLWELTEALFMTQLGLCFLGRFEEADHMEQELIPLAERIGHLGGLMCAGRVRAVIDVCSRGDFRALAAFTDRDEDLCKRAGMPWASHCYTWRGLSHLWGGDLPGALGQFEEAVRLDPPDIWHGGDWGFLAMGRAYAGDREGALAIWRERGPSLEPGQARTVGAWVQILCQVEVFAVLGERDQAAMLYPVVLEATKNAMVRPLDMQPVHSIAGIAAAAGGQWDKAEEHYETALRQAHELPIVFAQPEVRRWYARMLIDRDGPGDGERARELLGEAIEMYRRLGMPKHVEIAQALLAKT